MRSVVASIDIGSNFIKILLSEVIGGKVTVLETKIMDSKGVKGGQIIDQLEVSRIIKQGIEEISKSLRVQIKRAVLILPSANAKILTTNSKIKISNEFNMITKQDVEYVNEIARKPLESADVSIINSFPFKYTTDDGNSYEGAPIGCQSTTLTCEIIAYGIPRQTYSDYVSAVNLANIEVIDTQLSAWAFSHEAITEFEKERQAILLEIGHTTTTMSAFNGKYLVATKTLLVGGKHITDDIMQVFGIDAKQALLFKESYSHIGSTSQHPIHHGVLNGKKQMFTIEMLGQVVEARIMDILDEVKTFMCDKGLSKDTPLVIVGGCSNIDGLREFAAKQLNMIARRYRPDTVGARNSTLTGLLGATYAHYITHKDNPDREHSIDVVELELLSRPEKAKFFITKTWKSISERRLPKERV